MEIQKEGTADPSFFVNMKTGGQADRSTSGQVINFSLNPSIPLPLIPSIPPSLFPSVQSLFKKKLVKNYFLLDISVAFSYFYIKLCKGRFADK